MLGLLLLLAGCGGQNVSVGIGEEVEARPGWSTVLLDTGANLVLWCDHPAGWGVCLWNRPGGDNTTYCLCESGPGGCRCSAPPPGHSPWSAARRGSRCALTAGPANQWDTGETSPPPQ